MNANKSVLIYDRLIHFATAIIRLDELRQTFVVRLVIRLLYKDGHKAHYPSGQAIFSCASLKMNNRR